MPDAEDSAPHKPLEMRSFFLSSFTKGDWIALGAAMIAFLGFLGWMMDKVAQASIGDVKTEIALVTDAVQDSETNLKTAFAEHTKAVDEAVQGALKQRTEEIAKSLVAVFGEGNAVIVRVANVPMIDPTVMTAVQDFTTKFVAGTTLATFGNKAVVEAVMDGMVDEKARSLQGMIETLSGYPAVQTDIMFADPDELGALKAKFLREESGQN
jgi:hypothetical protein